MKQLLTGRCEKDFRQWLRPDITSDHRYSELITNCFDDFPVAMQFGVIQDFADSKGINITLHQLDSQSWYGYNITEFAKPAYMCGVWRRDKARQESIKQFNKIYNEKHRTKNRKLD